MTKERFKMLTYVALLLRRDDELLLVRRIKNGVYTLAGGGIDGDESIIHAAIREAYEELGITLLPDNLKIVHVVHSRQRDDEIETVGFFLEAHKWDGQPHNMEPHIHDEIGWFNQHKLPKNTKLHLIYVLEQLKSGRFFSEYGWE